MKKNIKLFPFYPPTSPYNHNILWARVAAMYSNEEYSSNVHKDLSYIKVILKLADQSRVFLLIDAPEAISHAPIILV